MDLEIRDLVKAYTSPDGVRHTVIDVPRFELEAGHQVALRGVSGSGKTTLLHCIAGIVRPDAGSIVVAGEDVALLDESERDAWRARHVGYVFQTFNLLQGFTALENVELGMLFGAGADPNHARHLLERVGLGERLHHRPRQLSVGQQQRVAVARAIANRPALVLADEPTGNLDFAHARGALTLLRDVCRESGAALLVVSHDRDVLAQFDDVRDFAVINRAVAHEVAQ